MSGVGWIAAALFAFFWLCERGRNITLAAALEKERETVAAAICLADKTIEESRVTLARCEAISAQVGVEIERVRRIREEMSP
jgi:transcriptional regulator